MKSSDAIFNRWKKAVSPGGCMEAPPEVDVNIAARMLANQEEFLATGFIGNRAERRKRNRK